MGKAHPAKTAQSCGTRLLESQNRIKNPTTKVRHPPLNRKYLCEAG